MSTEARQEGGSAEIHPDELMASWIYDEKFPTGMRFMFGTLPFMVGEGDDLKHPVQEKEEWRTITIDFEFHRDHKNLVTTFQATIRQPAMTNLMVQRDHRSGLHRRLPNHPS
jgi:hypothetical protein